MLISFIDHEGRETWVNPLHVRVVRTHESMLGKSKGSEIWFSFNSSSEAIYVKEPPAEVSARLNAAMPVAYLPSFSDGEASMNAGTKRVDAAD